MSELIYKKIAAVMAEVGAVAKNEKNVEQKFNYRGVDAVVNAVNPVLKKHGVFISHRVNKHVTERYENANKKIVTDAQVEIEYTWWAEDGSSLSTSVAAEARDFADKATAKAMSVAFRTHLLQMLALPTDDRDPDSESLEVTVADKAPVQPKAAPSKGGGTSMQGLQAIIRSAVEKDEIPHPRTGEMVDTKKVNSIDLNKFGATLVPEGDNYRTDMGALTKIVEKILG